MALAKGRRGDLGHRRFLIRPLGLAESQWAPAVAGLCGLALVTVAVLEIMTPNDVVASVGLLPLVAALWALSGRLAALVSLLAVVLFALMVLEDAEPPDAGVCRRCQSGDRYRAQAVRDEPG